MAHTKRLFRPLAALAAVTALVAAGCGGGSSEPQGDAAASPAASPSGTLVLYSGRSEALVGPLLERFTAETGVEVEVRYGDSAELAAQILEEGDRARPDVFFSQDAGALGALADQGVLADLPEATLERVDARYRDTEGQWVGLSGRARVAVYDPRQVDSPPASVLDLVQPEWKGKVAIAPTNASFQAFATALRVTEGEQAAEDFLEGLQANEVQIYEKNTGILDAVDSGEVALGLINHYYWYEKQAEVGADALQAELGWFEDGDPGSLVNVAGAGVLATAENPVAAQALIAWLLGEEAQTYFATETFEYPLIDGVAIIEGLRPLADLQGPELDLSDLASLGETLELLDSVGLT
jgi:iron(III) transport system substrate-binding protein